MLQIVLHGKGINPYGMIYVRSGTLTIGSDDQDLSSTYISRPKSISIAGFYMDETEITNNEYRQFVNWVRDSIAHTILGNMEEDDAGNSHIDWTADIDYTDEALSDMYFSGDDVISGKKEFDVDKLSSTTNGWIGNKLLPIVVNQPENVH